MNEPRSPKPEEIRELRARHKLTQDKLADSLYGIKRARVPDWESSRRTCPPITWWAMKLTWDGIDLWNEESET